MRNILLSIIFTIGVIALAITAGDKYSTAQISNIARTNAVRFVERDSSGHLARINDVQNLMRSLRAAGLAVKRGGQVSQPFFFVRGSILTVNGEQVQVFEYANNSNRRKGREKGFSNGQWCRNENADVDRTASLLQEWPTDCPVPW